MVVLHQLQDNFGKEWTCENPPTNPQKHCVKVSPLKPTVKPEHLEYMREILKFPFTIELKVSANGQHRYAFFDFKTPEAAVEGLKILRVHLGGRHYNSPAYDYNSRANFPNPRPFIPLTKGRACAVYVNNLHPATNYEDLRRFAAKMFYQNRFVGVPMAHYWNSYANPRLTAICYAIFLFETPGDADDARRQLLNLKAMNQLDGKIFTGWSRIEFARKYREYNSQVQTKAN